MIKELLDKIGAVPEWKINQERLNWYIEHRLAVDGDELYSVWRANFPTMDPEILEWNIRGQLEDEFWKTLRS